MAVKVPFCGSRPVWVLVLGLKLLAFQTITSAAPFDAFIVSRDAAATFRSFMEAWAYDQHWTMWEMGNEASRMAWSQNAFAEQVRLSRIRPAAGKQVEEIHVYPQSASYAEIVVRFSLEHHLQQRIRTFTMTVPMALQDGRWRFQLGDFLQLLNAGYWY
jgi:hypothetical protein